MTVKPWHPDIPVNIDIAKNCIEKQFRQLAPVRHIKQIGQGWDNTAYLVNKQLVFRFPHRKVAIELMEHENVILKQLQKIVQLEIPKPCYIGKPDESYPCPFHGYEILRGTSACHANLSDQNRIDSLPVIANFLKQLHGISETHALTIGAKPQRFDRTATTVFSEIKKRADSLSQQKIHLLDQNYLTEEISLAQQLRLPDNDKVLLHGDLYCRHLIFNRKKLTGIIDWGDSGINSRAVDLAVVFSFYPQHCQKKFLGLYGRDVDPQTWQYARFLGLYSAITTLSYGYSINDAMLINESIRAIRNINDKLLKTNR